MKIIRIFPCLSDESLLNKKSSLRYEILAQKIRYRRDILFSFEDLIVSFGGIAGLFLGYNFLDTLKMVYYVVSSFFEYLYKRFFVKNSPNAKGK
jgi:hypothetical protein